MHCECTVSVLLVYCECTVSVLTIWLARKSAITAKRRLYCHSHIYIFKHQLRLGLKFEINRSSSYFEFCII